MSDPALISTDEIRTRFSRAMSEMYRAEVPHYGTLMSLVAEVNAATLAADPALRAGLTRTGELERVDGERHGAIRLGTAAELSTMRRLFAVMGMVAVGYYDLSAAGVPVHSTAFRPIGDANLAKNPFRLFTSLLRLELIADPGLRSEAEAILARRRIFTPAALAMVERFERQGGLTGTEADLFVREALETFRWHGDATIDAETYARLSQAHRLVADVVSFRGPHINHLTPRTLDIDAVQARMPARGITPKEVIEGPPTRACPILLRQTSFRALAEPVMFAGATAAGSHTARFGEIEQRGLALTSKGRALYDRMLASVFEADDDGAGHAARLRTAFAAFPDDHETLRREGLGFFRYALAEEPPAHGVPTGPASIDALVAAGHVQAFPIIYEYFLPVSAAGIFQSNLDGGRPSSYGAQASRDAFVAALEGELRHESQLYQEAEDRSVAAVRAALDLGPEIAV